MKRWALLIVGVYFLLLAVLSLPGLLVAFDSRTDVFKVYRSPFVWICAGVMVLGEALLLVVPVGMAERRPRPRRRLIVPVLTSVFFISLLGLCTILNLFLVIHGENNVDENAFWTVTIASTLGLWLFWGWVFFTFRRTTKPSALTGRLMRWLLGGSILELLVAVPSHIIVRQRGDCCAPLATFFGISTGIAVMLMSFGPGVFFLYTSQMRRLRRQSTKCRKCGYDLRATADRCPECGTAVR